VSRNKAHIAMFVSSNEVYNLKINELKTYFCYALFLTLIFGDTRASAQGPEIKPVKKGEVVPDVSLILRTGNAVENAHVSDYKGKLILLDFWSTNCPDCIGAMPDMLELQNKFKDKIQVIIVTSDSEEDIKKLFAKMKGHTPEKILFAGSHLPFVMGDTIFLKMFPHYGVPQHVWIDENQIYRNITYNGTTTAENIQNFLDGKKVKLADVYLTTIDAERPLTWIGGTGDALPVIPEYSFFMRRLVNANGSGSRVVLTDSITNKVVGLAVTNETVLDIYREVFTLINNGKYIWSNNIFLEVSDKSKYIYPRGIELFNWEDSNTYCYARRVAPERSSRVAELMHRDLDCFFNTESAMEDRKVKCMVLKRISNDNKLEVEEKNRKEGFNLGKDDKLSLTLKNGEMYELFRRVSNVVHFSDEFMPIFDETHYTGKVNITIPYSSDAYGVTVAQIKEALRKYGLDLVEEYRTLNMLVIREKNYHSTDSNTSSSSK